MFIIDTLVAFSKLVTMLVIINVKQRLFLALCSISIIFTCPGYWKSQGISCGLESGHPGSWYADSNSRIYGVTY